MTETFLNLDFNQIGLIIIPALIGWIAKHYHTKWQTVKQITHDVRLVVDNLDNVIYNEKVDQNGLEANYEAVRKLLTDAPLIKGSKT